VFVLQVQPGALAGALEVEDANRRASEERHRLRSTAAQEVASHLSPSTYFWGHKAIISRTSEISERNIMAKKWPRDRYSGPGGGLYAGTGGGFDQFNGGGADRFNGGGLDRFNGGGLDQFNGGGLDQFNGGGLDRFNGGGLDRFNGGGLDRFNRGGLDPSPGGGLYAGPCSNPYKASTPPTEIFVQELRSRGYTAEADEIAEAHGLK
jgi:hypothetical protein